MNQVLNQIAKKHLHVKTLEARNSDHLDFYEVAVWSLKEALEEAYRAGQIAEHRIIA